MSFSAKKIHILIVEDNPGDFLLIEEYLKEEIEHPIIEHSTTFASAKGKLINGIHFDAILLDLSLPDASGRQLVIEMVELAGTIPVIVLTGFADKDFGIKTVSLGISDYVIKDDVTASTLYKSISYSIERHRFNDQLKQSEEKYRELFHFTPIPMMVFDLETFNYLDVNNATIKNYGYSREEFLAMTAKDIRPEEDVDLFKRKMKENEKTNILNLENITHRKKNGELIIVDIQTSLIDFEGKKARLIIATDVTERMKYIQAIEAQNAKLKEISWMQSHIVRAPLARMLGLIDAIQSQSFEEISYSKLINYILSAAKELDNVIMEITTKAEQVEVKAGN